MAAMRNVTVRVPTTIFGNGVVSEVGKVAKDLGAKKALIVTGQTIGKSETFKKVKISLEEAGVKTALFSDVDPNVPIDNVAACAKACRENNCDIFIGLGGGSTMDCTKAASVLASFDNIDKVDLSQWLGIEKMPRRGLPKILVPTTSGTGSEWTMSLVVLYQGRKASMVSPYNIPDAAIVDPMLTLEAPQKVTADTGMDALTHAVESYLGIRSNLWSEMVCESAIRAISGNLRQAWAGGGNNVEARFNMSFGSMIACNPITGAGAHLGHGMAHSLQTVMPDLTHGQSCSLMLPAVMEFDIPANPERSAKIAGLMGVNVEGLSILEQAEEGVEAVRQLSTDIGVPQRLRDIGLKKEDIAKVVNVLFEFQLRLVNQSPRKCTREDATKIFESVW